ncbi:MAG TPA: hypothetical protein V6C71_01135 [Coleofasciculaceae cyanobacterium]
MIKYGFRPAVPGLDLASVLDSPRSQNIPGSMPDLAIDIKQPPSSQEIAEIQSLWSRAR